MKDSRILREWLDANGNKINIAKSATNKATTADFTEKFKKLVDHIRTKYVARTIILGEYMLELIIVKPKLRLMIIYSPNRNGFDVLIKDRNTENVIENTFVYGGWNTVLDVLFQNNIITDKKLCEWVDNKGNKISTNKAPSQPATSGQSVDVVYIWDMYIDPKDKGNWCSAEEYNGEYDGSVFKTKEAAYNEGKIHLYELEDEGELRGDPEDYDIDVIAIPKNKVSAYTLRFSGL